MHHPQPRARVLAFIARNSLIRMSYLLCVVLPRVKYKADIYGCMLLPCCSGGDLFDGPFGVITTIQAGKVLPDETIRGYVKDMVQGVSFLHAHNMVHRDIKLDQLVVDTAGPGAKVRLTDIGEGKKLVRGGSGTLSTMAPTMCRTIKKNSVGHDRPGNGLVRAPEAILSAEFDGKKADIWAVGVTMYVLLKIGLHTRTDKAGWGDAYLFGQCAELSEICKKTQRQPDASGLSAWQRLTAGLDDCVVDLLDGILTEWPASSTARSTAVIEKAAIELRLTACEMLQHKWLGGTLSTEQIRRQRHGVGAEPAGERFSPDDMRVIAERLRGKEYAEQLETLVDIDEDELDEELEDCFDGLSERGLDTVKKDLSVLRSNRKKARHD